MLPADHAQSRHTNPRGISFEKLAGQAFIIAADRCAVIVKSLTEKAGLPLSDVRITIRDWISACMSVRDNLGAALIPQ